MRVQQARPPRSVPPSIAVEVYSAREISTAAEVPAPHVRHLIAAGEIGTVDGALVAHREALGAVRRLRANPLQPVRLVFGGALAGRSVEGASSGALSAATSTVLHGVVIVVAAMLASAQLSTAADRGDPDRPALARLVFVGDPGPGGGGGGGGLRQPMLPPRAERDGESRISSPVPPRDEPVVVEPVEEPEPEPIEPEVLPRVFAPLLEVRAGARDLRGLLEESTVAAASLGAGIDGGVGRGGGRGVGAGRGAGVGPGTGGGTGGGPYRPGAGISPPAIGYEVKPVYTEEARRRRVEGDVVLEVIVLADGTIGTVRVLRGLGYGLDETAVRAMREWRFHPAQRHGEPVDVVVEVAMEFRLR